MRFTETPLAGAFVLEPEKHHDERGFFANAWTAEELSAHGLNRSWAQSSISFNEKAGTMRGMHFQIAPHAETKLVTCTAGAVFDVIVDLRAESPTRLRWFGVELSVSNNLTYYVPEGFAHGFITLQDDSVVQYHMSAPQHVASARGVRWDDPAFGIEWPLVPTVMNQRDREYPDFEELS